MVNHSHEGTPRPGACFLYIMKAGEFLKVGITQDVEARHRDLQKSNPMLVTLMWFRDVGSASARQAEAAAHARLSEYRIRGEWFSAPFEVVKAACSDIATARARTDAVERRREEQRQENLRVYGKAEPTEADYLERLAVCRRGRGIRFKQEAKKIEALLVSPGRFSAVCPGHVAGGARG